MNTKRMYRLLLSFVICSLILVFVRHLVEKWRIEKVIEFNQAIVLHLDTCNFALKVFFDTMTRVLRRQGGIDSSKTFLENCRVLVNDKLRELSEIEPPPGETAEALLRACKAHLRFIESSFLPVIEAEIEARRSDTNLSRVSVDNALAVLNHQQNELSRSFDSIRNLQMQLASEAGYQLR